MPCSRKLLPIIFFILFLSSFSFASPFTLNINPSTLDTTVYVNQTKTIQLNFTLSSATETIYNISLVDAPSYIRMDPINTILVNETKSTNMYITTQSIFNDINLNLKFRGYFYSLIEKTPQTIEVNITPTNFNPSASSIYQGYSINYRNIDTIVHIITCTEFNANVIPGGVYNHQFNNIYTNYGITDSGFGFTHVLNVLNKTSYELTYNENNDRTIPLTIESKYIETTVTLDSTLSILNLTWNEGKEGVITIRNTGTQVAKNLKLSGEWMSFAENNFDISPGNENLLTFIVTPYITLTEETNKTYTKSITLTGDNINNLSREISIFINYHYFTGDEMTNSSMSSWWYWKTIYCRENPNSTLCLNEPLIEYVYITNLSNQTVNISVTEEMCRNALRGVLGLEDTLGRSFRDVQDACYSTNQSMQNVLSNSTASYTLNQEIYDWFKKSKWRDTALIILIIVLVISVSIAQYIRTLQKKREQEVSMNL